LQAEIVLKIWYGKPKEFVRLVDKTN